MTPPPEGDKPGGQEPFDGIPPEDLDTGEEVAGDLPDLEPEFVEALREAAGEQPDASDAELTAEEPEPEAAEPAPEEPAEAAEPDPEEPAPEAAKPASEEPASEDSQPAPEQAPDEDAEPAMGGAAEQPSPEQPTEEQEVPEAPDGEAASEPGDSTPGEGEQAPAATVEFTQQEVSAAQPAAPAPAAEPAPSAPAAEPAPQAGAPVAATPGIPQKPPPEGDAEPPPKRRRLWPRFLIGAFVIVTSVASATSASSLIYAQDLIDQLKGIPGVRQQLLPTDGGEPQNILILGSDRRASEPGTRGLSDTTILLRLDADNNAIALMSIPRDLKTYVPEVGVTKFNAAYAFGGPKLTLRTVKRVTGLPINHVVNVDFLGFVRAVNAINCVYVDVDRRYYHSTAGLPAELQYAEINIQPGYQKLCGKDALEYVRYRHTDTDLVRAARQQDFLREARHQIPPSDLFFDKRDELLDIFTSHTTSDIQDLPTMIQVLKLLVASRSAPIKEIHFPATLHPSYVTASRAAIQGAVEKFLGIEASGGPRGALDLLQSPGNTGIAPEEQKRSRAKKQASQEAKAPPTPSPGNDGLVDSSQFGHDLALKVTPKLLRSFPMFYPRRLPSGSIYVQVPRTYHLTDSDKNPHQAYKTVLQLPQGDYFGIQGVQGWSDPPNLTNPSESRTIGGREYDIYLDADRVRLISWHEGGNSYWVSNSLLQTISNDQMLGIARSVGKLPGERIRQKERRKQR